MIPSAVCDVTNLSSNERRDFVTGFIQLIVYYEALRRSSTGVTVAIIAGLHVVTGVCGKGTTPPSCDQSVHVNVFNCSPDETFVLAGALRRDSDLSLRQMS